MLNFFATWRQRQTAVRELSRLSDRQLADIGIARAEIGATVMAASAVEASAPSVAPAQAHDVAPALAPSWGVHNRRALAA